MRLALDYDDTFTKDPKFWRKVIDLAELHDHEIVIVTYRDKDLPIDHNVPIPVHYTAYQAKRKFMEDLGKPIDVFIDDSPETILQDSKWTDADRELWRQENHERIRKV